MVRADCHDCEGCSACCKGMGNSIILDPLDVWRLCNGLSLDFDGLLERCLELHVVDGMILPNLRMDGEGEACTFLDEQEDAPSTHTGRAYAGCFRWEDIMRKRVLSIFCRFTSAGRRTGARSR